MLFILIFFSLAFIVFLKTHNKHTHTQVVQIVRLFFFFQVFKMFIVEDRNYIVTTRNARAPDVDCQPVSFCLFLLNIDAFVHTHGHKSL